MENKKKSPAANHQDTQRATNANKNSNTAIRLRNAGLNWIRNNPELWNSFVVYATDEAKHERRISVQWLVENARKFDRVDSSGNPVRINNSLAPFFARQLISEHPECRPYVELRRSILDGQPNG